MCYSHHYAFDAADLLKDCLDQIQEVIECDERTQRGFHASTSCLYDMKEALVQVEHHLFCYFRFLIQKEIENAYVTEIHEAHAQQEEAFSVDFGLTVDFLKFVLVANATNAASMSTNDTDNTAILHSYYPRRNVTDSLLFRLNVVLQLCLLRIDDYNKVVTGRRRNDNTPSSKQLVRFSPLNIFFHSILPSTAGLIGVTALSCFILRRHFSLVSMSSIRLLDRFQPILWQATRTSAACVVIPWMYNKWGHLWMAWKSVRSTEEIEEWIRQWKLVESTSTTKKFPLSNSIRLKCNESNHIEENGEREMESQDEALDAARSQRLIEYVLHETHKTSFWHSQGELRFLMLKRAMDTFYASVGTAIDLTGSDGTHVSKERYTVNWQLNVTAAAAASFYWLTGARERAAAVTSSSESAQRLIQNAWGMVSLPTVKILSLKLSSLLKGAAVADRIEICGVSCFVLSSDPAPEVAAAIKRNQRFHQRRKPITRLSTIDEQEEHTPSIPCNTSPFARSSNTRYRQRNVIFHLTGGGFFAHIIATDLPHLLDWSAATHAVVICPEYALLPEHCFPEALNQVEVVYRALVTNQVVSTLGFETIRIIVTGESAGGNLAAALCVSLATSSNSSTTNSINGSRNNPSIELHADPMLPFLEKIDKGSTSFVRLPDALMLSCPVLNLSLELSYSAVVGAEDPVLPSGLISAISDAYLPPSLSINKNYPLASPFYASDATLRLFPPTLLFASSKDPLLDDSVTFNQRLRSCGVQSDLIAARNLPHAYLGLGTAGFPEARQIQERCVIWLNNQFSRNKNLELKQQ